jgi:hypothetical protein
MAERRGGAGLLRTLRSRAGADAEPSSAPRIQHVIVAKLDRLGRNVEDVLRTTKVLDALGICIHFTAVQRFCKWLCRLSELESRFQRRFTVVELAPPTAGDIHRLLTNRWPAIRPDIARQIATFACGNVGQALKDADSALAVVPLAAAALVRFRAHPPPGQSKDAPLGVEVHNAGSCYDDRGIPITFLQIEAPAGQEPWFRLMRIDQNANVRGV